MPTWIPTLTWLVLVVSCARKPPESAYHFVAVEPRDFRIATLASGFIEPDTIVEIKAKTSGELVTLATDVGQVVQRGSLLAEIDRRTPRNALAQAEAAFEVQTTRLAQAESSLRRYDELFKSQSVTQQEHDSVQLALTRERAAMVDARLAVDNAKIALDNTSIRAPITGTIIAKGVERGQIVSSPSGDVSGGTMLFQLADLTLMQAQVNVDEIDIGRIRPGQTASITTPAYPGQTFSGTVLKVEPQADTVNSVTVFKVKTRVANPSSRLIVGMRADVEFELAGRKGVLAVPNTAFDVADSSVTRTDSTARVLFISRGGVPTPVEVRTGVTDLDYTEILDGLSQGDSVLVPRPGRTDEVVAELQRRRGLAELPAGRR